MRPYRVRYAGKAVRDLMDLWDYLAEAAGPLRVFYGGRAFSA